MVSYLVTMVSVQWVQWGVLKHYLYGGGTVILVDMFGFVHLPAWWRHSHTCWYAWVGSLTCMVEVQSYLLICLGGFSYLHGGGTVILVDMFGWVQLPAWWRHSHTCWYVWVGSPTCMVEAQSYLLICLRGFSYLHGGGTVTLVDMFGLVHLPAWWRHSHTCWYVWVGSPTCMVEAQSYLLICLGGFTYLYGGGTVILVDMFGWVHLPVWWRHSHTCWYVWVGSLTCMVEAQSYLLICLGWFCWSQYRVQHPCPEARWRWESGRGRAPRNSCVHRPS